MDATRPAHFFKYMTSRTAHRVLENGTLQWATPSRFNDPFDVQFDLHLEVDPARLKALTLQKCWEAYIAVDYKPDPANAMGAVINEARGNSRRLSREESDLKFRRSSDLSVTNLLKILPQAQAEIRETMGKSKILCLSAVGNSILMWSYYTENHQGAVLRFKNTLADKHGARPICYSRKMPRLFDDESLSTMLAGHPMLAPADVIDRMVYTKAEQWSHEGEWRLFDGVGNEPDQPVEYRSLDDLEPDALILGCAMSAADRASLTTLAAKRYPHAKVIQARKADREFELVVPED